jgi:hypothetical protein
MAISTLPVKTLLKRVTDTMTMQALDAVTTPVDALLSFVNGTFTLVNGVLTIAQSVIISGNTTITGNQTVNGNQAIRGGQSILGSSIVNGTLIVGASANINGNVNAAGGYKHCTHMVSIDGVAASLSAVVPFAGGGSARLVYQTMPWAGSLAGTSIQIANTTVPAGSLTVTPVINGVRQTAAALVLGTGANRVAVAYPVDTYPFAVTSNVYFDVTTTATWTSTTSVINISMWAYA